MNGGEVVAALVGLDGGSHSILSIKEAIKLLPTPLDRSSVKLFFSYLEELKEHVIKVGGHVHDADRRVLLTCGETRRLFIRATFQHHHLQTLRTGPPGAIITSWKGSVNIVRCTWHLATLELQCYN